MTLFDLPLAELEQYQPPLTRRPDFEQFWRKTLIEVVGYPLNGELKPVAYPVPEILAYQATYDGWQGARITAWYLRPLAPPPLPAMVFYHGYSRSRNEIYHYLPWVLQGYAVLAVDVRGQAGGVWDNSRYDHGHVKGWLTKGILDKEQYYYRGVYVDCVRALNFLATQDDVDMSHVGVCGFSQGGGLALAVAALDNRPAFAIASMPFLCHFERPLEVSRGYPYWELADYLRLYPEHREQMFTTLSYFDNLNLADWIRCPVLMSVGLLDDICPPSTVYAVYNQLRTTKAITVFPYHEHERPDHHWQTQLQWANHYLRGIVEPPV